MHASSIGRCRCFCETTAADQQARLVERLLRCQSGSTGRRHTEDRVRTASPSAGVRQRVSVDGAAPARDGRSRRRRDTSSPGTSKQHNTTLSASSRASRPSRRSRDRPHSPPGRSDRTARSTAVPSAVRTARSDWRGRRAGPRAGSRRAGGDERPIERVRALVGPLVSSEGRYGCAGTSRDSKLMRRDERRGLASRARMAAILKNWRRRGSCSVDEAARLSDECVS